MNKGARADRKGGDGESESCHSRRRSAEGGGPGGAIRTRHKRRKDFLWLSSVFPLEGL